MSGVSKPTPSIVALSWAQEREWWLGDRSGGWASGTVSSILTRKYHALLAVPDPVPEKITLLLSKYEEAVVTGNERCELSANQYPNTVHPDGYARISRFSFDSAVARWTYSAADRRLSKEIWRENGRDCTHVRYTLLEGEPAGLEVRPFVSGRAAHAIGLPAPMAEPSSFSYDEHGLSFSSPVPWSIRIEHGHFRSAPDIYRNFQYPLEAARLEQFSEDLFCPGPFEFYLKEGQHATLSAQTEPRPSGAPDSPGFLASSPSGSASDSEPEDASHRLDRIVDDFRLYNRFGRNPALESLVRASDIFIIRDGRRHNIIAGYPYFGRWARDAMISLPGLCIHTGRHALARDIITYWLENARNGLLPNRFDSKNRPVYESSDGMLWLFWAASVLDSEGGLSEPALRSWWPALNSSLRAWISGNGRVALDGDGLVKLEYGRDTWMDASQDGHPITPRAGKRVEINALWVHALAQGAKWAERLADRPSAELFNEAHMAARGAFSRFFNPYSHYLDDGLDPTDGALRPNALWAIALPDIGLNASQQAESLAAIKEKLLIEGAGLRTLSPDDPHYHARYRGGLRERDQAYHQGAAWPWLLGAYVEASLRARPHRPMDAYRSLEPFLAPERAGALFSIPELFDPSNREAGGAPLQAWSVGEVLRGLILIERATSFPAAGTGFKSIKDMALKNPSHLSHSSGRRPAHGGLHHG
ncbi:MAG: amylo-alpha-1,6-glucosidase [Candidatus Micrarchaeota archaeon]